MLSRQILRAIPKCAPVSARAAHTDKEFANLDYYRTQEQRKNFHYFFEVNSRYRRALNFSTKISVFSVNSRTYTTAFIHTTQSNLKISYFFYKK